jgi:chromosome segregation ATPase
VPARERAGARGGLAIVGPSSAARADSLRKGRGVVDQIREKLAGSSWFMPLIAAIFGGLIAWTALTQAESRTQGEEQAVLRSLDVRVTRIEATGSPTVQAVQREVELLQKQVDANASIRQSDAVQTSLLAQLEAQIATLNASTAKLGDRISSVQRDLDGLRGALGEGGIRVPPERPPPGP